MQTVTTIQTIAKPIWQQTMTIAELVKTNVLLKNSASVLSVIVSTPTVYDSEYENIKFILSYSENL